MTLVFHVQQDRFGAITREDLAAALRAAERPNDLLGALLAAEVDRLRAERAMLLRLAEEVPHG